MSALKDSDSSFLRESIKLAYFVTAAVVNWATLHLKSRIEWSTLFLWQAFLSYSIGFRRRLTSSLPISFRCLLWIRLSCLLHLAACSRLCSPSIGCQMIHFLQRISHPFSRRHCLRSIRSLLCQNCFRPREFH